MNAAPRSALEPLQRARKSVSADARPPERLSVAIPRLDDAAVHGLRLFGELHRFIPVLAHYRGFRIAELPVNHGPREHGRSRYGVERYLRGFLDLLTVSFIGRYRHRPLHLFGGLGLILGVFGTAILVYLTVLKTLGHAIGHRPLLMLGVLLLVIGMQFFSLGLISEMITSHHEERAPERGRAELLVDEILS